MVVFITLTTSPPSKSLQVCPGTQGGYHAANRWDIVILPLRSVTLLRGTVIHRGAGGPGRALFIPFAPVGYRSRMLTVEPESVTELMNSVPVMPSELLAEGAAVGSPLGTQASLNFSPLDQGCEEAEGVPATDPVPAPKEEDMPEAPADAEERPAAPADADAAPPPPTSAAEEDVLTPDAIPQPVCFVSQAEQPSDPPVPYVGDVLLLQEGMSAGLFVTPTDHAHAGPTTKAARADACLTPHIHRWWLPPPEATDRCRVRCTAGTVVYLFAALGAAFVREPGAVRMAWMAMAHPTPPRSSQDAEMLGLARVDKARRTICSCSEKVCPRGALHARDFVARPTHLACAKYRIGAPTSQLARANFHLGARRVTSWRAKCPVGARQVQFWRAPSLVLPRQVASWRAPSPILALVGAAGEGLGKAEGGVGAAADRHGAGACSWGGGRGWHRPRPCAACAVPAGRGG